MEPADDPQFWRDRAADARALADAINDRQSKEAMLRVAHEYERLAEEAASAEAMRLNELSASARSPSPLRPLPPEKP